MTKLRGNIETESRSKFRDNAQKLKKTVQSEKRQSQTLADDIDVDIVKLRKDKQLKKNVKKNNKKNK